MPTSRIYPGFFRTWYEAAKEASVAFLNAVNVRGKIEVEVADQISPAIFAKFRRETGVALLTADLAIEDRVVNVDSVTGAAVGEILLLRDVSNNRFTFFNIVAINTLAITVDRPVDFEYTVANSTVSYASDNLAVDGSVTPVVFSLRDSANPQIPTVADITRIIFSMITVGSCTLPKFGDQTALTNGITLRHVDGVTRNLFNIKSNREFTSIAYDLQFYSAVGQGQEGLSCRLTFAGQSKVGVAIRIGADEDLQLIVSDDLSGLTEFKIQAEGHVVAD